MNMNFIRINLASSRPADFRKKTDLWGLCLKNQRGQAIVELSLLMLLLAIILMALIIIHELGIKNIFAIETLRHDMRVSMLNHARNPFTKNFVQKDVFVDLPGKMKLVFRAPYIVSHHEIEFYEGSYQGSGDSKYNRKFLYRKIDLQN
jgi:hypothetical protein